MVTLIEKAKMMRQLINFSLLLTVAISFFVLLSCNVADSSKGNGPRLENLPGKIVYSAQKGSETHLFITDEQGTRQLTSSEGVTGNYYASDPSFSPDGQWVVYISNRDGAAKRIYMIRADGSDRKPLMDANGVHVEGENPVFSPDNKQIAFNQVEKGEPEYYNNDIYVITLASGKISKLTQNTGHDIAPSWSPDGTKIAFASGRDYENGDTLRFRKDLYVINTDGTALKRLTKTGNATRPKWSSNGKEIAYEWNSNGNYEFIYHLPSEKIDTVKSGLKFSGGGIWNYKGSELLVGGREGDNASPELRLLDIEQKSFRVLQVIKLGIPIGNYDWYSK